MSLKAPSHANEISRELLGGLPLATLYKEFAAPLTIETERDAPGYSAQAYFRLFGGAPRAILFGCARITRRPHRFGNLRGEFVGRQPNATPNSNDVKTHGPIPQSICETDAVREIRKINAKNA